jgi:hypothetical protein
MLRQMISTLVSVLSVVLAGFLSPLDVSAIQTTGTPLLAAAIPHESGCMNETAGLDAAPPSVMSWGMEFQSLAELAAVLNDDLDFFKGKLFLEAGLPSDAKKWLTRYLERLGAMPQDDEVTRAVLDTRTLLARCV